MSIQLFDRQVQVVIYSTDKNAGQPIMKIPAEQEKTKLKIDFSITEFMDTVTPDDNTITLYNLSDKTISFIESRGQKIDLFVGFRGYLSLIFSGEIGALSSSVQTTNYDVEDKQGVTHKRQNFDMVTTISLTNGFSLRSAMFSKTYQIATSVKTILSDALETLNFKHGSLDVIPDKMMPAGKSFDQETVKTINELINEEGVECRWFIEKGMIKFDKIGKAADTTPVSISAQTGLIGFPEKTEEGVKLQMLFNPQLELGQPVALKVGKDSQSVFARKFNGKYKIKEMTHIGSSYDGDMLTEIKADYCHACN